MDPAGKKVLKVHKTNIKDNLYLSDRILDILEETDTVNEEIAQKVKAEKTNEEKIDKLLYYLKRRGHKAFGNFIDAIRSDPVNETLAEQLQTEYDQASGNLQSRIDNEVSPNQSMERTNEPPNRQIEPSHSNGVTKMAYSSQESLNNLTLDNELQQQQQNLRELYTLLKAHMTSLNMRELSFSSPQQITFQTVKELIEDYMRSVRNCYDILGAKDKTMSMFSRIVNLKAQIRELKGEMRDMKSSKDKLTNQYIRLENKHRDRDYKADLLGRENANLTQQIDELKSKLDGAEEVIKILKQRLGLFEENKASEKQHKAIQVPNDEALDLPQAKTTISYGLKSTRSSVSTTTQNGNFSQRRRQRAPQTSRNPGPYTHRSNKSTDDIDEAYKACPLVKFDRIKTDLKYRVNKQTPANFVLGNTGTSDTEADQDFMLTVKRSPKLMRRKNFYGGKFKKQANTN